MSAKKSHHISSRRAAALVSALVAVGIVTLGGAYDATGAGAGRWYEINLEAGEVDGYGWAAGAKGPKREPLDEICATVSVVEPLRPDAPYAEGSDSVVCGSLSRPMDWVAAESGFGSGDSSLMVLTVLYRPVVRKATFLLGTGERRVFSPRMAKVRNRQARGIPGFRYVVAPFRGETCIRKVTLFDRKGVIIDSAAWQSCNDRS